MHGAHMLEHPQPGNPARLDYGDTKMQAIVTRYHGPGNVRGTRVSATAAAGRIYLDWDHALNQDENHKLAARLFAQKYNWGGKWLCGVMANGDYCHVNAEAQP
jgi:hypothetical protein